MVVDRPAKKVDAQGSGVEDKGILRVMNGRLSAWTALVTLILSVVSTIVLVSFILGGRVQTPEQKRRLIHDEIAPLIERISSVERMSIENHEDVKSHLGLAGHQTMDSRMGAVEQDLTEIKADVKLLLQRTK